MGPAEITATWLGSVLGEEISSVSVEPIGTGQTGATYRLTPAYARPSELPRSLIAKLPSQLEEVRERVALGYRAEHAFYTQVADTVAVPLPRIYHCDIAGDGSEFVLLLSDLTPRCKGTKFVAVTTSRRDWRLRHLPACTAHAGATPRG
jgi:hypothetical protein